MVNYFIFDMDETLAELYPMYYLVASLRLKETVEEDNTILDEPIPESLIYALNKAYNIFVDDILKEETSDKPLGILRPGVLNVMSKLYELQKQNKIKNVIIYSNNGHLESLEFIRDLIHKHLGTINLIKECIHWNHPMRDEERFVRPGSANKTWNVLRNILIEGKCKASSQIQPADIYFFDDLDHIDLQEKLGSNYYKVPGYDFKASFDRIADIYRGALYDANVDLEEFVIYTIYTFLNDDDKAELADISLNSILNVFRDKTRNTASIEDMPPEPDRGIEMMMEAIKKVSPENKIGGGARQQRRRAVIGTRKKKLRRRKIAMTKKKLISQAR
jgi:hypothetical protein